MTAPAAARSASDRYRRHVLYECSALRDECCQVCRDLSRDAAAEDGRRFGWAPDEREWDGWGR